MALEIERKFLVTDLKALGTPECAKHLVQGYLNKDPERTVRVRLEERLNAEGVVLSALGTLTVKGKTFQGSRLEEEVEIPVEQAKTLLGLALPRLIDKTRYVFKAQGAVEGLIWEVDVFHGELAGLVLAEVELPSIDTAVLIPEGIGEEVTHDPQYFNSNLSNA